MKSHEKSPDTVHDTDSVRTKREKRTVKLTDRQVKNLTVPETGSRIDYDEKITGFGLRSYSNGRKVFILNFYFKGRERRMVIGSYPEWTVLAARRKAEELRLLVANGVDPLERRQNDHAAPTVKDMFERYDRDYLPKLAKRHASNIRVMVKRDVLPKLGAKKVVDVTFNDCEALHRRITRTHAMKANRLLEVVRRMFNLAIRWGWLERNPVFGLEWNQEEKRERYLNSDEISRLIKALDEHPRRTSCEALKFMLLTGCRRGEALGATWDQFDTDLKVWTKPAATTKQRKLHRVPVSSEVTRLLKARFKEKSSAFVFDGGTGQALTDVKKTWASVIKTAKLENVRIHDLRHTFASIAVSSGQTLPVIGAMLGHTQPQTTARYAHLVDASLALAAEAVSNSINKQTL